MIRVILTALFLFVYFIISLPLLLVEWLISLVAPKWRRRPVIFRSVIFALSVIRGLSGCRLTVIGKDRIPKNETVLYVGNHQSYFDIVISYSLMTRYTGFIAKKSMKVIPVLPWLMTYVNCLFLDRSDIRQGMEVILQAIDLVKGGVDVFIYPEGTRNHHPDTLLEFHKGSFKIAQRTDCPIVPITIVGSRDTFERQFPRILALPVILEYGDPFRFSELSPEDKKNVHTYTASLIEKTYRKNKALPASSSQTNAR